MTTLDLDRFTAWLQRLGDQPCGERRSEAICPVARWMREDLGMRGATVSTHAYREAPGKTEKTLPVRMQHFVREIDSDCRVLQWSSSTDRWEEPFISASDALAIWEECPP